MGAFAATTTHCISAKKARDALSSGDGTTAGLAGVVTANPALLVFEGRDLLADAARVIDFGAAFVVA